jgi:hypothetical protein
MAYNGLAMPSWASNEQIILTNKNKDNAQLGIGGVIARLFSNNWTKWELIYIYNFSITIRSIEVRQNRKDGRVQFRVKKIAHPVHAKYFDVEDVKRSLSNVL